MPQLPDVPCTATSSVSRTPSEPEVLTRWLLPLLQVVLAGDAVQHDGAIIDLCFEEVGSLLGAHAPGLSGIMHAMRVAVDGALRHRPTVMAPWAASVQPHEKHSRRKSVMIAPADTSKGESASISRRTSMMSVRSRRRSSAKSTILDVQAVGASALNGTPAGATDTAEEVEDSEEIWQDEVADSYDSDTYTDISHDADNSAVVPLAVVHSSLPPTKRQSAAAVIGDPAEMEHEEEMLLALQADEHEAAAILQRHRRSVQKRRAMPEIRRLVRQQLQERGAAVQLQRLARGWLARSEGIRAFKRVRAARSVQRAERSRVRWRLRRKLLHEGEGLSEWSVERALAVRDGFLLLNDAEKKALLPTLLSTESTAIEMLHQAGDLWSSLPPVGRATAVMGYLKACEHSERKQVLRLCLQSTSTADLLDLLQFISTCAEQYWGLSPSELTQSFLRQQPVRLAAMAEDRLLDDLLQMLPAGAIARQMRRITLHAHLPAIRSHLPSRIATHSWQSALVPAAPPHSVRDARHPRQLNDPVGLPPLLGRVVLTSRETSAPLQRPDLPIASPRTLKISSLERHARSRGHSRQTSDTH